MSTKKRTADMQLTKDDDSRDEVTGLAFERSLRIPLHYGAELSLYYLSVASGRESNIYDTFFSFSTAR